MSRSGASSYTPNSSPTSPTDTKRLPNNIPVRIRSTSQPTSKSIISKENRLVNNARNETLASQRAGFTVSKQVENEKLVSCSTKDTKTCSNFKQNDETRGSVEEVKIKPKENVNRKLSETGARIKSGPNNSNQQAFKETTLCTPMNLKSTLPKTNVGSIVATQTLKNQYRTKKKRYDILKNDLVNKLRLMIKFHKESVQLKEKLEASDVRVEANEEIETIDLTNIFQCLTTKFDPEASKAFPRTTSATVKEETSEIDPKITEDIKSVLNEASRLLKEILMQISAKHNTFTETLEKLSSHSNSKEIQDKFALVKNKNLIFEHEIQKTFSEYEQQIISLIDKLESLFENSNNTQPSEAVTQLQVELRIKDQKLINLEENLKKSEKAGENIVLLENKIKALQNQLENEQQALRENKEKNANYDSTIKNLNEKIKLFELKNNDTESKYTDLQKNFRYIQNQMKTDQYHWSKEREELNNKCKQGKQILDKLIRKKSRFDVIGLFNITIRCVYDLFLSPDFNLL